MLITERFVRSGTNNKLHDNPKGGRNEARLTNFGGTSSALLDPESTGALTVFAFKLERATRRDGMSCLGMSTRNRRGTDRRARRAGRARQVDDMVAGSAGYS